jgi:hypothetical protein
MGAAIPSLTRLLNSKERGVPSSAVSALAKLAEDREQHRNMITRLLI